MSSLLGVGKQRGTYPETGPPLRVTNAITDSAFEFAPDPAEAGLPGTAQGNVNGFPALGTLTFFLFWPRRM